MEFYFPYAENRKIFEKVDHEAEFDDEGMGYEGQIKKLKSLSSLENSSENLVFKSMNLRGLQNSDFTTARESIFQKQSDTSHKMPDPQPFAQDKIKEHDNLVMKVTDAVETSFSAANKINKYANLRKYIKPLEKALSKVPPEYVLNCVNGVNKFIQKYRNVKN